MNTAQKAQLAKMEKNLSLVAGIEIELTLISPSKMQFCIGYESDSIEPFEKIKKYFGTGAEWHMDDAGYDEECEFSVYWFTPIEK